MKLLGFLLRHQRVPALAAILLGMAGGASAALFMASVGRIAMGSAPGGAALAGALAALYLCANLASQLVLNRLGQDALLRLRTTLGRAILELPLRRLEALGGHRFLAVLADDAVCIAQALANIPTVCIYAATIVSCLAYLFWLSPVAGLAWLALGAAGAGAYHVLQMRGQRAFQQARLHEDDLLRHFRSLLDGAKELKLGERRRQAFLEEELDASAAGYAARMQLGMDVYSWARAMGEGLVYAFLLGLAAAPSAWTGLDRPVVAQCVMISLFFFAPLIILVNLAPLFARAEVAVASVRSLGLDLQAEHGGAREPGAFPSPAVLRGAGFSRIQLRSVAYEHAVAPGEPGFRFGPVDLDFRVGETVFLAGGNGSGKTTLLKILCGLYPPGQGTILWDGSEVGPSDRRAYRQLFSAVFADFQLFAPRIHVPTGFDERLAHQLLEHLELSHKVGLRDGRFTTHKLSSGQMRRLALLLAMLEDRPFVVLDEVAADQDPGFRRRFYEEILPGLSRPGRTILAITHDDRFFPVADRILHLEEGTLKRPMEHA